MSNSKPGLKLINPAFNESFEIASNICVWHQTFWYCQRKLYLEFLIKSRSEIFSKIDNLKKREERKQILKAFETENS